jgi:hypothetical protein
MTERETAADIVNRLDLSFDVDVLDELLQFISRTQNYRADSTIDAKLWTMLRDLRRSIVEANRYKKMLQAELKE